MSSSPKISVVMAVHRETPFMQPAIDSILNQTFQDFEFIIVANNCDDSLFNQLTELKDQRIKVYRTSIPQLSFNLNYGIDKAKSEFIARMDADDIALPDRLELQYKYILENDLDIVGSNFIVIDESDKEISTVELPKNNTKIRSLLPYKSSICHPSVLMKKSTVLKVGGYLGGRFSEDYSLWLRCSRDQNIIFGNIQKSLLKYRINEGQSKGSKIAYAEVAGLIWTEFLLSPSIKKCIGSILSSIKIFKGRH